MNPLDADATNDFAKFLYQSEDIQIDTQTSSETSDLKDDSYDILVAKVGEKDARESSSSTGQMGDLLENGKRVPKISEGCK